MSVPPEPTKASRPDPQATGPEELTIDLAPEDYLALAAFLALIVVVFLQVFTRYVLNSSFGWTEEIARYLLVATAFLGGAMGVRHGAHIAVGPFGARTGLRRLFAFTAGLASLAFYGYSAWLAVAIAGALKRQRMTVIDVPISVLYYAVALGFAFMFLRYAFRALRKHPEEETRA